MLLFLFYTVPSDFYLKEIKVQDQIKTNFLDLLPEKPDKISFYKVLETYPSAESSDLILMLAYYKKYVNVKFLEYEEFKRRLSLPVITKQVLENRRTEYIIGQTLLGVGVYSWSFPYFVYGKQVNEYHLATGFIFPFIYFLFNYLYTEKTNISSSQSYASFAGGIAGMFHGLFLFDNDIRAIFPMSIVENYFDNYLCFAGSITPGVYQRKINHNIYGYYHYFMLQALINDAFRSAPKDYKISSIISILEGYSALYLFRNEKNISFGDALFELRAANIGATFIPSLLITYQNFTNESLKTRTYALSSLLGHSLGFFVGYNFSKKYDLSLPSSFLTYLVPQMVNLFTLGVITLSRSDLLFKLGPSIFVLLDATVTFAIYNSLKETEITTSRNENKINLSFDINPNFFEKKCSFNPRISLDFKFSL